MSEPSNPHRRPTQPGRGVVVEVPPFPTFFCGPTPSGGFQLRRPETGEGILLSVEERALVKAQI